MKAITNYELRITSELSELSELTNTLITNF